jgi:hypothetical protein
MRNLQIKNADMIAQDSQVLDLGIVKTETIAFAFAFEGEQKTLTLKIRELSGSEKKYIDIEIA